MTQENTAARNAVRRALLATLAPVEPSYVKRNRETHRVGLQQGGTYRIVVTAPAGSPGGVYNRESPFSARDRDTLFTIKNLSLWDALVRHRGPDGTAVMHEWDRDDLERAFEKGFIEEV